MLRVIRSSLIAAFAFVLAAPTVGAAPAAAAGKPPSVAVLNFDSTGLTAWWSGYNFDPGAALADVFTDKLVNAGGYSVVDRTHLQSVLQEHSLSASGSVEPSTQAQIGRLTGAGYLIVGRIIQFERTGHQGGNLGGFMGNNLGLGGVGVSKTVLRVSVKVLEVNTGRIVEAIDDDKSTSTTSFSVGDFAPGVGGSYSNSEFESSAMGKLISGVADDLVQKMDPTKMTSTTATGTGIRGRVLTVDGDDIVLNVGSNKGVAEGMYFDVLDVKQLKDPDSGRTITSEIQKGTIQIVSVTADSAVAKRVSGVVHALQVVRSE
jgi:curli biogenesis system outer membrane secretion channel CsgG